MARGNDTDAHREFAETYGISGNAEELINANRARRNTTVQAASNLPVDEEASADLDLTSIDAPDGAEVVDAKVRGRYVSYVYLGPRGTLEHDAVVRDDIPKGQQKLAREHAGERSVEDAVAAVNAERDAEMARVRAEHAAAIEEATAKAREDATKAAQKAAQKLDADAAKAAKAAADGK